MDLPAGQDRSRASEFPSTQWSLVIAAGERDASAGQRALAELCRAYWQPLYTFARRRGLAAADAQDATQDFFVFLLEQGLVARADRERGRFRSFLLGSFRHFLADRHDHATALKRGGGALHLSWETIAASEEGIHALSDAATPETCFDLTWARMLTQRALDAVREAYEERGRGETFLALRAFLAGSDLPTYVDAGQQLGLTEAAVASAIHRLRQDYRTALRRLVAQTVRDPAEIDDELRYLLSALTRAPG
ncbi:MAG: RNA polymerase sigma factor [Gemmatimonadales bacterium]